MTSTAGIYNTPDGKTIEIREVWAHNLDKEMELIQEMLLKYPVVAMDTEFPGVVARPNGDFAPTEIHYQTLRCNVDLLRIIQLGLSFTDINGNYGQPCCCFQFNFKFSLTGDIYAEDSIELLKASGIDFNKFENEGVDVVLFAEMMMMSGLVLNDKIKWVSFHSSYDFGYLVKLLTCADLPTDENSFLELLKIFFPTIYDVKYMMTAVEGCYGGLSSLADQLNVTRIGPMHQAGSDSLLTAQTFFALIQKQFNNTIDDAKFKNELYGMGNNHTKYKNKGYTNNNNNINSSNVMGISINNRNNPNNVNINNNNNNNNSSSSNVLQINTNVNINNNNAMTGSASLNNSFQVYEEDNNNSNNNSMNQIYGSP